MERAWELWIESFPNLALATVQVTIPLSVVSFLIALLFAVITALIRNAKIPILTQICAFYVWVFRGTPLLVQLFIVYYGLPKISLTLDAWSAAIVTLSLNTGAYASEAIRSAILAIPKGQWEAAYSLNLSYSHLLWKIIAPQAFRIALPPLGNDFIDLVKGTSLVSTITITDVFMTGQQIAARTFEPLILYTEVAVIYLFICTLLTFLQGKLERSLSIQV